MCIYFVQMILNVSTCYFVTIIYIPKIVFSNDQVDEEHLNLYPYCGRLFGYRSQGGKAKSRVVNSEDSNEHELYPWVVYLEQRYLHKGNKHVFSYCSGTVIAYKHVVTAGHCICTTWGGGDTLPDFQTSYVSICRGDSGSGNWITVDKDHAKHWKKDKLGFDMKMSQRVLVTITTFQKLVTRDRKFDFSKLPFIGFVCGSDVTLDDGTRLVSAQYGTKTTKMKEF